MEHLVTFQTAEGREGTHTAESLDEALRFVERLRNNEEASGVRLFRMQEVPIEFRTYFKVEVGDGADAAPPSMSAEEEAESPAPEQEPALVATAGNEPSPEASDAARRLFHRG